MGPETINGVSGCLNKMSDFSCKPAVCQISSYVLVAAKSDMPLGIQYGLRSRDGAENRALEKPGGAGTFPSNADGNLRSTAPHAVPRIDPHDQWAESM